MKPLARRTSIILAVAALAATWSCGPDSHDPLTVKADAHLATPDASGMSLLSCSALPADSTTQAVGPEGGTIHVGPHQLVIPAGALDSTVSITAVAPSGQIRLVQFQPQGLTFNTPASLTLSYANCGILTPLLPKYVAYLDGGLNIQEVLSSVDVQSASTVTGSLGHFSDYAVAW